MELVFSFCVQLCATLHVRMVHVLPMTLAVVQQDMWDQGAQNKVFRSSTPPHTQKKIANLGWRGLAYW